MTQSVAIIDYGCGNLFSVENAIKKISRSYFITSDPKEIKTADKIILPGVGSFKIAMKNLNELGLNKVLVDESIKGKPILGICLGMQLLLSKSYEHGETVGLNLISGDVVPFIPIENYPVPHIGWNDVRLGKRVPSYFDGIPEGTSFYFVHSFYCDIKEDIPSLIVNYCDHDVVIGIQKDNISGVQFHPEKSQDAGIQLLKNFIMEESISC